MVTKEKNIITPPDFGDIRVIGINSVLADYKLVWLLNKHLSFKLTRQDDFVHEGAIYPYYYYTMGENSPLYGLLAVSYEKRSILSFKPRLDYLFIIREESLPQRVNTIFEKIKEIEGVNYAFLMDGYMEKLESAIYDVEQYDSVILARERGILSPEYAKEEIRQRNLILGLEQP